MFAEIAVNRRVRGTFHYHIPGHLTGAIGPGHLVKISFGTAHTTGVVVALHDEAPIPETKPVLERLDPEPVVTPAQLELAHWLARETVAPLGVCLWLMLPPGLAKRGDFEYALVDRPHEAASPLQRRIVSLLQRRGPLRGRQLDRALPRARWRSAMASLIRKGTVDHVAVLDPPDVKPKTIRTAQLAIPPRRVPLIAPRLGRESRRANILEVLLADDDHRLSLGAVLVAVGCTEAPVRTLEKSGDLRVTAKETTVELAMSAAEVKARLDAGDFDRAPAQRAVLEALLAAGGSLPTSAIDTPAAARLAEAGTVRRWTEPAWVELAIAPEVAQQRIIELRGGQPYLDVLNYLAQAGDAVDVAEVNRETGADLARLQQLEEDGLIVFGENEAWRDPLIDREYVPSVSPPLTLAQTQAWNTIREHMDTVQWGELSPEGKASNVFLLHGVTGSGKTEIYMRAVERALAQGRQAIVLVPEIALTPQTVRRFAGRFPGRVSVIHSGLTQGERFDVWRRARAGEIHVVVGARSALFAPLPDVGLIILDEEHDDSYKQSPPIVPPYYHAREAAIALARITRGTVLLGSATPDVTTAYRARQGDYRLLQLPERIIAPRERMAEQIRRLNAPSARYHPADASDAVKTQLPVVQVVDMRQELREGNRSVFSYALRAALEDTLARQEQAILFLNRRGTATFVMCRDCGTIASCPRCSTPLTYHSPHEALMCHYCGFSRGHFDTCPSCGSDRIKHFGQGTELIEAAVQGAFPTARTLRWDRDTTGGPDAHEAILSQFSAGEADILVGTQMVAKGLDLPQVTLVGIVSADTALGLPDFRAGERTFQLLTQVAGRAGRGAQGGRVVLQSYVPEHYAIRTAAEHDYETFYQQELAYRREQHYPPFKRLARLLFIYPSAERAEHEARRAAALLQDRVERDHFTATEIIGPTPCFFAKRNNLYRWHLVIRSANPTALLSEIDIADGWHVDIDPVDML